MSSEPPAALSSPFDAAAVIAEFDGDVEFVQKLASLIGASLPRYIDELKAAAAAAEWVQVARAAHSVRGSVGNAYATRLDGLSRAVEAIARSGGPVPPALITEFDEAASELLSEFVLWAENLSDDTVATPDRR